MYLASTFTAGTPFAKKCRCAGSRAGWKRAAIHDCEDNESECRPLEVSKPVSPILGHREAIWLYRRAGGSTECTDYRACVQVTDNAYQPFAVGHCRQHACPGQRCRLHYQPQSGRGSRCRHRDRLLLRASHFGFHVRHRFYGGVGASAPTGNVSFAVLATLVNAAVFICVMTARGGPSKSSTSLWRSWRSVLFPSAQRAVSIWPRSGRIWHRTLPEANRFSRCLPCSSRR